MKSFILLLYILIAIPNIVFSQSDEIKNQEDSNIIIKNNHQKLGIVLSGGGGRGAYQVGVWKYLVECGLDKDIRAFAGTSIGAINSILFAEDNYELVEHVWTKEIEGKVIPPMKFFSILSSIPKAIIRFFVHRGMFARDELVKIIDRFVDLEAVSNDNRTIFASCSTITSLFPLKFEPKYLKLNGGSSDRIKSILFATSALLFLFEAENIDGTKYIDGMYTSQVPIQALYEHGCDAVIVVYLNSKDIVKDKSIFGDMTIYEIIPQSKLGGFFTGTLDFSESGARKRIEAGYQNAKNVINTHFGIKDNLETCKNL